MSIGFECAVMPAGIEPGWLIERNSYDYSATANHVDLWPRGTRFCSRSIVRGSDAVNERGQADLCCLLNRLAAWQSNAECAALPGAFAGWIDGAMVIFDDAMRDAEPQARALPCFLCRIEWFE